jgi:hypothetical protein
MDNLQGYSTPLGTTPSDNWNYDNLEGRFLRISISKCPLFLLIFRIAQIAEIEVYGCEKTDQIPILGENSLVAAEETAVPQNSNEEKDFQSSSIGQGNVLSVPGKPVITFYQ